MDSKTPDKFIARKWGVEVVARPVEYIRIPLLVATLLPRLKQERPHRKGCEAREIVGAAALGSGNEARPPGGTGESR